MQMQLPFQFMVSTILTLLSFQARGQTDNEIKIYNSLIDSLYELKTCFKIIDPPFYKCCDVDTLYGDDLNKCCENSPVPKQYRIKCFSCVNKGDFDTLNVLMLMSESFFALDIKKDKKYLLSRVDKNSIYYDFIKKIKHPVRAQKFVSCSLKQQNLQYITKAEFDKKGFVLQYGKYRRQIFLGSCDFSRIYIDTKKGLGIFEINWIGGNLCGYSKYFLIYRDAGRWKIFKKILSGVY